MGEQTSKKGKLPILSHTLFEITQPAPVQRRLLLLVLIDISPSLIFTSEGSSITFGSSGQKIFVTQSSLQSDSIIFHKAKNFKDPVQPKKSLTKKITGTA